MVAALKYIPVGQNTENQFILLSIMYVYGKIK